MNLYEVQDMTRENFGRMGIDTTFLKIALQEGRRRIERVGNWWWMKGEWEFTIAVDTREYNIGDGEVIDIANFKDVRKINWRRTTETRWDDLQIGQYEKGELEEMYEDDDEGDPEEAVIENNGELDVLTVFPTPNVECDGKIFFYQYTDNPTDVTQSDQLLRNYGMALHYAAVEWGYAEHLKDLQGAAYWTNKLDNKDTGLIAQIRRENFKRDWKDKINLEPHTGPGKLSRRRLDNRQIYR